MRKLFLLVVILAALIATASAQVPQYEVDLNNKYQQELRNIQAPDTFVNNGDGKVVIIDKRPRTIIRKQQPTKTVEIPEPQPVIVNVPENRDLENYMEHERRFGGVDLTYVLLGTMIGMFIMWVYIRSNNVDSCTRKCECKCNNDPDNYKDASVVNHFHVAGGYANANIDKSIHIVDNGMSLEDHSPSNKTPDFVKAYLNTANSPAEDVKA